MFRSARVSVLAAAVALIAALAMPAASQARTCSLSTYDQRHLGATYVLQLTVRNYTCSNGKKLVKAYHACRRRNGGADGFCRSVNRFKCSERRFNKTRTEYDSRVTCTRGSRVVKHVYTQFI
jgi:hypothetical protein